MPISVYHGLLAYAVAARNHNLRDKLLPPESLGIQVVDKLELAPAKFKRGDICCCANA